MEEDIQNYSPTVMFPGTPCRLRGWLRDINPVIFYRLRGWLREQNDEVCFQPNPSFNRNLFLSSRLQYL